ncbi:hypothetical protein [Rhodoferax sediminis]|jgi:hypothetical protein|uniref:hypothetical protein n=1 Tax=Rhodoferax sediminis TaxID=2509614 RepID=UPI00115EECBC|nr:hypothetical protein [Rhodoferax sediminis]
MLVIRDHGDCLAIALDDDTRLGIVPRRMEGETIPSTLDLSTSEQPGYFTKGGAKLDEKPGPRFSENQY